MSTDAAAELIALLAGRKETFAAAESCTGGLISAAMTSIAGSSDVHWGGAVTYSNDAKVGILGVDPALLASEGAVSSAVAKAMAWGMRSISGVDWTVAVTGIAGPGGGTPDKPVGTVWIGWCGPTGETASRLFRFDGDRKDVRARATAAALEGVLGMVKGGTPSSVLDR